MVGIVGRQRGWIGLIGLLLALVIVALLGRTLLQQMGMLPNADTVRAAGAAGDKPRGPATGMAPIDNTGATPAPTNAVERARDLGATLQQQAEDLDKKLGDK